MRHATSCVQCRLSKRKCTRQQAEQVCKHCKCNGNACSFKSKPIVTLPKPPVQEQEACNLLDEESIRHLIATYLELIHGRPHSIFHEATLWRDINEKVVNESLLYAICSLASSLSPRTELQRQGPELASHSKKLLNNDLENVCLQNVQTCIVLANVYAAELLSASEALYFGIANRMAHLLKLHVPATGDNQVVRETKARVWWTLVMADHWCSNGLGIPRQVYGSPMTIGLPIEEAVFQSMSPDQASTDDTMKKPPALGLWAYMITLVDILGPIHDLNQRLAEYDLDEMTADCQVDILAQKLDSWLESLPIHIQLSDENLETHRQIGLGGTLVALHLGYHHYSTLLYFQYLDLRRPQTPMSDTYMRRCKYHAHSYGRLLAQSRKRRGCAAVYATVGHMTVVSSSVLLHTLLFGSDGELAESRSLLTSNFEALIELKKFWPSLERTLSRLSAFQDACMLSSNTNTHRFDRWMIRFLLEHSMPLETRDASPENPYVQRTSPLPEARDFYPSSERQQAARNAVATFWA